jgi:hypothetical protein
LECHASDVSFAHTVPWDTASQLSWQKKHGTAEAEARHNEELHLDAVSERDRLTEICQGLREDLSHALTKLEETRRTASTALVAAEVRANGRREGSDDTRVFLQRANAIVALYNTPVLSIFCGSNHRPLRRQMGTDSTLRSFDNKGGTSCSLYTGF